MIPTSIDGTDITGATIDGQDVQEITVDGQTVFTAQTLPVAYSNLVAWWPFDAATYGGSNLDDVTGILGGSADNTAYNGTFAAGTGSHDGNGGVTDINAGANSGGFELSSTIARVDFGPIPFVNGMTNFTIAFWLNRAFFKDFANPITSQNNNTPPDRSRIEITSNSNVYDYFDGSGIDSLINTSTPIANNVTSNYHHFVLTADGTTVQTYENGNASVNVSQNGPWFAPEAEFTMGARESTSSGPAIQGLYDDVRLYNRALTASEVSQIYQNTQP